MLTSQNLPRNFYAQDTVRVAHNLLGHHLLRRMKHGDILAKIVEVEAYLGKEDPASHASAGKTARAQIFWGIPGRAYIFVIYGIHHCLNVITRPKGEPGCVLIRAVEPLKGLELMYKNRPHVKGVTLTNGPAKLCQAMAIDLRQNGVDLTSSKSKLQIVKGDCTKFEVAVTPRVGISKARDELLRFAISGNPYVSRE